MEGECTGDQATHGEADHGGLLNLQVVEQFGELGGIAFQAGVGGRQRALAVAEHVVGDDAVVIGQANNLPAHISLFRPTPWISTTGWPWPTDR